MPLPKNANPKYSKSLELYAQAEQWFPYGTQLWSRSPHLGPYGQAPIYFERARGCRFWDVDGNEFIDTGMAVGPVTLGYCYDAVDRAVKAQIDQGVLGTINNAVEIEMAQTLGQMIPSAEMVKFCKGGGEADAIAVRLARGYTGKDIVLFCGYHGWHDWYISGNLASESTLDSHLLPGINPKGVPAALAGTTAPFEYGNLDSLQQALQRHVGHVACIIMEPTRFAHPGPGYLESVRQLADDHGCLLIFDEVVTGFRMTGGSAQAYYGVTPDLTALGKAIANGYALAAVVGKRAVMAPQEDNFISSTYFSDTVSLAAGVATLKEIQQEDVCRVNDATGLKIRQGLAAAAHKHGLHARTEGHDSHFHLAFDYGTQSSELSTLYAQEMIARGIYNTGTFYVCYQHTDDDVARIVAAAEQSFAVVARALQQGNVSTVLQAPIKAQGFRRMV